MRLDRIRTALQVIYFDEERRGLDDPYNTIDFGLVTLGTGIDALDETRKRLSEIGHG